MVETSLLEAIELGGFFAAHAVWCVSSGEALIPLIGYQTHDGSRQQRRFQADRLENAVQMAMEHFDTNPMQAAQAVLIYDGYITEVLPPHTNTARPPKRTDTLFTIMRTYQPDAEFAIQIPYRHAQHSAGFGVYDLQCVQHPSQTSDLPLHAEVLDMFFRGVENHEHGARIWQTHLLKQSVD